MKKIIPVLLVFLLQLNFANGQRNRFANLRNTQKKNTADTSYVKKLNRTSNEFLNTNLYDSCRYYANLAIDAADGLLSTDAKNNDSYSNTCKKLKAKAYNIIAQSYRAQGNMTGARKNNLTAIKLLKDAGEAPPDVARADSDSVDKKHPRFGNRIKELLENLQNKKDSGDKKGISNVLSKIGNAYIKEGDYKQALIYLEQARQEAAKSNNKAALKDSYHDLSKAKLNLKDYKSAYEFDQLYVAMKDSIEIEKNAARIAQLQLQNDFDKKEAVQKATQQKKDELVQAELQRQELIRNASVCALALVLIFLFVVFVQKKRISKEKHRSEELLLNILPAETAAELKANGVAQSKSFDEVTVLFTDFKNFTLVSEKLSAEELVKEINYCYSNFDNILTKYGVEKIKTIGDSYMCAGGLPVEKKTNAEDTLMVALAIRDFMIDEKHKRAAQGKEFFEIRIGLHTGPVVAGIVGIKKFAYDIWGDTVNIASRIEHASEAGKINISGSTYQKVKDKFACHHRGKIHAKNKGEIDMYFVEGLV